MHFIITLILTAITFQWVFASAQWPNEPAGATLISDWGFDNIEGGGWTAPYGVAGEIVEDTAPLSASNVLRNTRNATSNNGVDLRCAMPVAQQDQVYFGYWFKPSAPHSGWRGWSYQKISIINGGAPHIYMLMKEIDINNGTFILGPLIEKQTAVFDTANAHIQPAGNLGLAANINNPTLRVGQWHRIEIYAKQSTTASSRDGIIMWWVNGLLCGHFTTINFAIPIREVWIANIWDSVYRDLPFAEYVEYDHVHVSYPVNGGPHPVYLAIPLSFALPGPTKGVAYSGTVQTLASGTKMPLTWTVSAGALPAGLSLDSGTGRIYGTPTCAGSSNFAVKVMDKSQPPLSAERAFKLIVAGSGCSSGIDGVKLPTVNSLRLTAEPKMASVTFLISQSGSHSITVYDLSGREVWQHTGNGEAVWQHGGRLNKGIYLVRAKQNGKSVTRNYCHAW